MQSIQSEGFKGITKEVLFVLMPVTIALAAFLISWWLELSGGILLVISYLALSLSPAIHAIYYGPGFQIYIGMFAFAAPFLISGVLLIVAAQLSRRAS